MRLTLLPGRNPVAKTESGHRSCTNSTYGVPDLMLASIAAVAAVAGEE